VSKAEERELPLRITLVRPPPGVRFAVQRGRDGLLPPAHASPGALTFELSVRAAPRADGTVNVLGPFAHGPPAGRFLYVCSGTRAGQPDSCWTRRMKIGTAGITAALVAETLAAPGAVLEARVAGTATDGGPACATVPLLDGGWRVSR
jgi:uncharacterized protein DUF5990